MNGNTNNWLSFYQELKIEHFKTTGIKYIFENKVLYIKYILVNFPTCAIHNEDAFKELVIYLSCLQNYEALNFKYQFWLNVRNWILSKKECILRMCSILMISDWYRWNMSSPPRLFLTIGISFGAGMLVGFLYYSQDSVIPAVQNIYKPFKSDFIKTEASRISAGIFSEPEKKLPIKNITQQQDESLAKPTITFHDYKVS